MQTLAGRTRSFLLSAALSRQKPAQTAVLQPTFPTVSYRSCLSLLILMRSVQERPAMLCTDCPGVAGRLVLRGRGTSPGPMAPLPLNRKYQPEVHSASCSPNKGLMSIKLDISVLVCSSSVAASLSRARSLSLCKRFIHSHPPLIHFPDQYTNQPCYIS